MNTMKITVRDYNNKLYDFDVDEKTGAVPSLVRFYPNISALEYTVNNGHSWRL